MQLIPEKNEMYTKHAAIRMQQRAVPPLIVEWLSEFGAEAHDGRGAVRRYFDHKGRKRLESAVGSVVVERLNEYLDAYLVEKLDGTVITVGRRTRRIGRP